LTTGLPKRLLIYLQNIGSLAIKGFQLTAKIKSFDFKLTTLIMKIMMDFTNRRSLTIKSAPFGSAFNEKKNINHMIYISR